MREKEDLFLSSFLAASSETAATVEGKTDQTDSSKVELFRQNVHPDILNLIPKRLAEQHQVFPIELIGNKLIVGMHDPLDYIAIDELRMCTGYRIEPIAIPLDELQRAIKRHYGLQESLDQIMQSIEQIEETDMEEELESADSPVVKTVNQIILQAVMTEASDIHIDPQEEGVEIRYRVDGMLRTEQVLPKHMQNVITARIKIMSELNLTERRLPQDGRINLNLDAYDIDIRVATLPTIHGEKIVMRLLDKNNGLSAIDQLGFSDVNMANFTKSIKRSHGIVLLTGPTGSGKTTTLYSALSQLNTKEVNVITIEDPVEYHLQGINQVHVNSNTGLTFARGLRSILRQDPNIIMVGEIRDSETAEICVRAAMTGHLVLSTLHTNSAISSINRLIDMGVEPFLVSSSVIGVVAQRLVRRICPHCAESHEATHQEKVLLKVHQLSSDQLKKGKGCEHCGKTGFRGRLAIHEMVVMDDTLRNMILEKKPDNEYREYVSKKGYVPLFQDGLLKVSQGLTTIQEIFRVTSLE